MKVFIYLVFEAVLTVCEMRSERLALPYMLLTL